MNLDEFFGKRSISLTMYLMAIFCNMAMRMVQLEDFTLELILSIVVAMVIYTAAIFLSKYMSRIAGREPSGLDSSVRLLAWISGCIILLPIMIAELTPVFAVLAIVLGYVLIDFLIFKVLKVS